MADLGSLSTFKLNIKPYYGKNVLNVTERKRTLVLPFKPKYIPNPIARPTVARTNTAARPTSRIRLARASCWNFRSYSASG